MRFSLCFFCFVLVCSAVNDIAFEWGEWTHKECSEMVDKARQKNSKLIRGICDVVQDQVEKFMEYFGNEWAKKLNLSFSKDIAPRFKEHPYIHQGKKGIKSVIEYAILHNTKTRTTLGAELEKWGKDWIGRVAENADHSNIEFTTVDKMHERIAQYKEDFMSGETPTKEEL